MIKVLTAGVFDVLNLGHINILTQASQLGDHLIVAIQDDAHVAICKGKNPVLNVNERVSQIQALPFVDETVVYGDQDLRPLWDEIQPNIIVQGDDYIHSGNRIDALRYITNNGIRLCLLPRTQGISSSEIKTRIMHSARKDAQHIKNIRLMHTQDLCLYEQFDEGKVCILANKIKQEGIFKNPISVGKYKDIHIVVDGVNRLEAIKRLGYEYITALVLPYTDIDLTSNVHFDHDGKITRLSEFSSSLGSRRDFPKRTHEEIYQMIQRGQTIANGETWHRLPYNVINFRVMLSDLMPGTDFDQIIQDLIKSNNIRFYSSNVYNCDEWQ
jgi:cytidyltransferase-like protein